MTHKSYKPMFETLEQELLELNSMADETVERFYGTSSIEDARVSIINCWRGEYNDEEIKEALLFVEETLNEDDN